MTQRSLTATLKYSLSSPKKMNLVAKMVRGMPVSKAVRFLSFLPKKPAKTLLKLVKSAMSNAKNNLDISTDTLFIESIFVGKGPKIKRIRPVGRGRMHRYEKHRSFVKVSLGVE